jgi:hypothetical protein
MNIAKVPIVIFTYKRIDSLKETIESLLASIHAEESLLYIFSDGPKNSTDEKAVAEVRKYLKEIKGFKGIEFFFAEKNQGLANSIINGINKIFETYDSVIVLEDDLVVSKNFLTYMHSALAFYKDDPKVFSISGYNIPMVADPDYKYDIYFTLRASSWGWATWKDRWEKVDWAVSDFKEFSNNKQLINEFNKGGSDLFRMLKRQQLGEIDSWAIRWCYQQFKTNSYCAYPTISKIVNVGFNDTATNSNSYNRYASQLDTGAKLNFNFPIAVEENKKFLKISTDFFSYRSRIIGKLKTYLYKTGIISNK